MSNENRISDLEYLAYHDILTGIYNRNWLYEHMYCSKYKYVYFFDINDLREINDKKGHIAGDRFIKKIIDNIDKKENEILIRYAGDEFILLSNRINALKTNKFF
ncbi:MAG: diguanylate cyclase, partial [Candidatus Pacearchaeota archaeon]